MFDRPASIASAISLSRFAIELELLATYPIEKKSRKKRALKIPYVLSVKNTRLLFFIGGSEGALEGADEGWVEGTVDGCIDGDIEGEVDGTPVGEVGAKDG